MNLVTEAEVLAGEKRITVELRDGSTLEVKCLALPWAASCKVITEDDAGRVIHAVLNGVEKENQTDAFLNRLPPLALSQIADVVMQLTNGLPTLKKILAARNPAPPATPISTPPPANCATPDTPAMS